MKQALFLIIIFFVLSCSSTSTLNKDINFELHAGISHGGVIENTDMSVSGDFPADAYSGATSGGISLGGRANIALKQNGIKIGLDYLGNKQLISYSDNLNAYTGTRSFFTSQVRLPMLYSFHILNNQDGKPHIRLNAGLSPGLVFCSERSAEGTVPGYNVSNLSFGPVLGLDIIPRYFQNGHSLGVSFEVERSFQKNYDDFYQLGEMPGAAYLRAGLIYGF